MHADRKDPWEPGISQSEHLRRQAATWGETNLQRVTRRLFLDLADSAERYEKELAGLETMGRNHPHYAETYRRIADEHERRNMQAYAREEAAQRALGFYKGRDGRLHHVSEGRADAPQ